MKRILRAGGIALVLAGAGLVAPASAGTPPANVEFGDDFFDPEQASSSLVGGGNEVTWTRQAGSEGDHNVREDSRLFRSGPIGDETEFNTYSVSVSAGSWRYFCEIHGTRAHNPGDMDGRLKVRPAFLSANGETALIRWADADDETGNAYRVQWRRQGTRKWRTWKRTTSAVQGRFGASGKPTDPRPSAVYQVRVRSFVKSNPQRTSAYSPALSFAVAPL